MDTVTGAMGLDSRIGPKYLKGAVSYGGPCFPRDNLAFAALARQVGLTAEFVQATDHFNRWQIRWLADLVQQHSTGRRPAGILGMAYKPNTGVTEQAFGFLLAQELARRGHAVIGYDPMGKDIPTAAFEPGVRLAGTAQECIKRSQVVVVATPCQEFLKLPASHWAHHRVPCTVIDCWRALKHLGGVKGIHYLGLGIGDFGTSAPKWGTKMTSRQATAARNPPARAKRNHP